LGSHGAVFATPHEPIHYMTADEAGTPCHQNSLSHGIGLCSRARSPNFRPTTQCALSKSDTHPRLQSAIDSHGVEMPAANGSTITARAPASETPRAFMSPRWAVRRDPEAPRGRMEFKG